MGTKFLLFSALEDENDTFSDNVNLISQYLGSNVIDLD
jgi:hypothetical protein